MTDEIVGNDPIRFHEVLRNLIESSQYRKNRAPIWRALNISSAALSQYVSGEARPRLEVLAALADFFEVSLDYLVLGKRPKTNVGDESRSMIRHVDWAVSDMQEKVGAQAWLTARVANALVDKIRVEVETVSNERGSVVGLVPDAEMLVLEQCSLETAIVTRDLKYDLLVSGGEFALGRFSQVVAQNLMLPVPRPYRFLVERSAKWKYAVAQFKNLMRDDLKVSEERLSYWEFRSTTSRIFGGLTFYRLDIDQLRIDSPMLMFGLEPFITADDFIVFTTRPNDEIGCDILHSAKEAAASLLTLNELWTDAKPL